MLENLLLTKIRTLSDVLSDLTRSIESRKQVSRNVIVHIQAHYLCIKNKLLELDEWQMGRNRSIESRRTSLEGQLDILLREHRQEQIKCWQDIAALKKEVRAWFKDYQDIKQRVDIVTLKGEATRHPG